MLDTPKRRRFVLFLVKPSHYDDDGYVIQWMKSALPSNSLACLYGIAQERDGDGGARRGRRYRDLRPSTRPTPAVRPDKIARQIKDAGGFGMVGFVGVQSNQFPRVMDCARPLRAAGIPVCIGGFHVSGCLAMLKETPDSLKEALDLGISLFAGEAEGRFADVLCDAAAGTLNPIYNYLDDLPNLDGATHPIMPRENVKNTISMISSFDAGRGCPFLCSFCTIINVQGRKSRYRSADDIEEIVRSNQKNGVRYFFITDDNLARNRNWEAIFDRLIKLRQEGLNSRFVIQVDTACHKIPRFIEKAAAAGRQARVHRLGKHRPGQSPRGEEEAEPHLRLPRASARVAKAPLHHLLRLYHRLPGRHARNRSSAASRSSSANCRSTFCSSPASPRCPAARTTPRRSRRGSTSTPTSTSSTSSMWSATIRA